MSPVPESNRDRLRDIAHRAMSQRGLLPDFSPAALEETEAIGKAATDPGPAIRDLRDLLWCSIDNDDSRDLDQLTVAAPMRDGTVKVLVAVADVDALVPTGSAIDDHARANTTSVYTAAQIFPMLPGRLSTDLTSPGQDQARLTIVVEMVVTAEGTVAASDVYRAVVLNRAKLAYNGVAAWLEGTA
ncbi:MAG TPA: RNB domain-containing ribonuclease, partial [Methylomirabilota bacterium]|nr:RNB domain-containing ribonuclease [Methylomirabilota bacterium]